MEAEDSSFREDLVEEDDNSVHTTNVVEHYEDVQPGLEVETIEHNEVEVEEQEVEDHGVVEEGFTEEVGAEDEVSDPGEEITNEMEDVEDDINEEFAQNEEEIVEEVDESSKDSSIQNNEEVEGQEAEDNEEEVKPDNQSDSNSDDDFDNVVEVEEVKQDGVGGGEISDENEENVQEQEVKLGEVAEDDLRGSSDSENEEEVAEGVSPSKRRPGVISDDEDDGPEEKKSSEAVLKMFDSDSENEDKDEGVGELIADIFGESDEEEEFTGFGQEEVKDNKEKEESSSEDEAALDVVRGKAKKPKEPAHHSRADDSGSDDGGNAVQMSDFDIMMAKKKAQSTRRHRNRDGGSIISDADDQIMAMLRLMKDAAEADRLSNQKRQPALRKMKLLPRIMAHLKKQDLREAFVDNGLIQCVAEWLSPLPDRSLPHLSIRTEFLKSLHGMPPVSAETLKHSGIGRAVMYLYKHPKEIRKNKEIAGRLINKWSRPIFGINENYSSLSREERELRDLEQMPQAKRRRLSSGKHGNDESNDMGDQQVLRPGEEGFIIRARVPMPSTKDYVVRPKSRVELEPGQVIKDRKKRRDDRLDKHIKNFAEHKKRSKVERAIKISIEGNKMGL